LHYSLGANHDGSGESSAQCGDENFIMSAKTGLNKNLNNRFLFSCCSQRSFYTTLRS